jgi:LmbE family N-acetylglucosaminyl deacetylase
MGFRMTASNNLRLMVVTAHPDDAEIFMWGSLCAWQREGATIQLLVATSGEAGARPGQAIANLGQCREQEAVTASVALEIKPDFLRFPDGALSESPGLVKALENRIKAFNPDVVVTHSPIDYHADHRALAMAVQNAASFRVPVLYADPLGGVGFEPTVYVDITPYKGAKVTAIRCHLSQDPERFVARAGLQNQWRAFQCNGGLDDWAEAFRFEPRYPFTDIRNLLPPAPKVKRL